MQLLLQSILIWWPLFLALALIVLMVTIFEYRMWVRSRCSPVDEESLRAPGQSRLYGLNDARWRFVALLVGVVVSIVLMVESARHSDLQVILVYGGFGAVSALFMVLLWYVTREIFQKRVRLDAELHAGQELNLLMRDGAYVFHDLFMDKRKGNIDHIVIGPGGVFSVETKARSKAVDDGTDRAKVLFDGKTLMYPGGARESRPVAQAESQARWLEEFLTGSTGEQVRVTPVIALPGRFVETRGEHRLRVINPKRGNALRSWVIQEKIDSKQVERIAWAIEQRCRKVKPWSRQFDTDSGGEDNA